MIQYSDRPNSRVDKAIALNKETEFLPTLRTLAKILIETRFLAPRDRSYLLDGLAMEKCNTKAMYHNPIP
ncbi:hypothetical protein PN466_08620 [Roseofilum reptotaenium CS-1145]|uniref:Uncharacterized protein n=1 Tax=Roseofilum reptotaenium AO1-A TaxID=1925591 RepID=A0A1L9QR39_9CYAN|nr:hypothetical protein [Roseofilum reptotaenium]MDB9517010.1 hypothetical protein [Roseofilum reptotaenium CS-1145]OJJ25141.1 hypothetical protein BI308_13210 [Roseofilum reptotaenium AO1-A]